MHEQSDTLQQTDLWAQNEPKSVSIAKGCLSVNLSMCSVCQKVGVYKQHLPHTAPQYDIPSEGDCRPDEVPIELAPCDECLLDEVELNTVTISSMSTNSKPVETDGKRGRHREITADSGAAKSIVSPVKWPIVDQKPSMGSVKGQRYVGPGGEKNEKWGEEALTVKVRTKQHSRGDLSSRVTLQGAEVRKPLLAVSGVTDRGNIAVFDGSGSLKLPGQCAGVASVRDAVTRVQGRPLQFVWTWKLDASSTDSVGSLLKGPSNMLRKPGPPVRPFKEKTLGAVGGAEHFGRGAKRVCKGSGRCQHGRRSGSDGQQRR